MKFIAPGNVVNKSQVYAKAVLTPRLVESCTGFTLRAVLTPQSERSGSLPLVSKVILTLCANLPLKSALKYAEFWKHALVTQVVSDPAVPGSLFPCTHELQCGFFHFYPMQGVEESLVLGRQSDVVYIISKLQPNV